MTAAYVIQRLGRLGVRLGIALALWVMAAVAAESVPYTAGLITAEIATAPTSRAYQLAQLSRPGANSHRPCPSGTRGRHPRCRPIVTPPRRCPPGTTGRYPRCRPIVTPPRRCPPGTTGRYPRCRPIVTPPRRCPPGTTGRYPRCRPIVNRRFHRTLTGVGPSAANASNAAHAAGSVAIPIAGGSKRGRSARAAHADAGRNAHRSGRRKNPSPSRHGGSADLRRDRHARRRRAAP